MSINEILGLTGATFEITLSLKGLLAEILDQGDEAMDLFRHSTDLGFHPQGALGYGHWVCRKLMQSPNTSSPYVIDKLHAIPVACDALTWYIREYNIPYFE